MERNGGLPSLFGTSYVDKSTMDLDALQFACAASSKGPVWMVELMFLPIKCQMDIFRQLTKGAGRKYFLRFCRLYIFITSI